MDIVDKLEKVAGALQLIEELLDKTQAKHSPKLQRLFKRVHSMEKARVAMKQVQQVQELLQAGQNRSLSENILPDNILPVLLMLLSNLSAAESPAEQS